MSVRVHDKRERGMTLAELMVAGALLSIVTAYLMGTFTASQKNYVVVDQVTEAQQNMRTVAGFMEFDVRHAGFMVPLGASWCAVDNTNTSDVLFLSDSTVITPGNRVDADFGAELAGLNNVAVGNQNLNIDDVIIDGAASYDSDSNGTLDADFQIGGGVIVTDAADPRRGTACGFITDVNLVGSSLDVDLQGNLAPPDPAIGGVELIVVPAHVYQLDNNLLLSRNGEAFVQGVEDFQISVFVDINDDNIIDAGEQLGNGVDPDYTSGLVNHADAREIRMNLVMRTRVQAADWNQGQFQLTENRAGGGVGGNDGFRRRVHTSTVVLRNVASRQV